MRSVLGYGVVLAALFGMVSARGAEPTRDSLPVVRQNLASGKAVLVDVRELEEWNDGHLQEATLLPLSRIERGVSAEQLAKVAPAQKIIYLHCASGYRCLDAADQLKKSGRDVRPLKQGYRELVKAGFAAAK